MKHQVDTNTKAESLTAFLTLIRGASYPIDADAIKKLLPKGLLGDLSVQSHVDFQHIRSALNELAKHNSYVSAGTALDIKSDAERPFQITIASAYENDQEKVSAYPTPLVAETSLKIAFTAIAEIADAVAREALLKIANKYRTKLIEQYCTFILCEIPVSSEITSKMIEKITPAKGQYSRIFQDCDFSVIVINILNSILTSDSLRAGLDAAKGEIEAIQDSQLKKLKDRLLAVVAAYDTEADKTIEDVISKIVISKPLEKSFDDMLAAAQPDPRKLALIQTKANYVKYKEVLDILFSEKKLYKEKEFDSLHNKINSLPQSKKLHALKAAYVQRAYDKFLEQLAKATSIQEALGIVNQTNPGNGYLTLIKDNKDYTNILSLLQTLNEECLSAANFALYLQKKDELSTGAKKIIEALVQKIFEPQFEKLLAQIISKCALQNSSANAAEELEKLKNALDPEKDARLKLLLNHVQYVNCVAIIKMLCEGKPDKAGKLPGADQADLKRIIDNTKIFRRDFIDTFSDAINKAKKDDLAGLIQRYDMSWTVVGSTILKSFIISLTESERKQIDSALDILKELQKKKPNYDELSNAAKKLESKSLCTACDTLIVRLRPALPPIQTVIDGPSTPVPSTPPLTPTGIRDRVISTLSETREVAAEAARNLFSTPVAQTMNTAIASVVAAITPAQPTAEEIAARQAAETARAATTAAQAKFKEFFAALQAATETCCKVILLFCCCGGGVPKGIQNLLKHKPKENGAIDSYEFENCKTLLQTLLNELNARIAITYSCLGLRRRSGETTAFYELWQRDLTQLQTEHAVLQPPTTAPAT